jgi:AcrR family transcriptional regulator
MTAPSTPAPAKPLRADAQRNRARLLEVAEQAFTERGTGVPTEEIARLAGVGVGTVFRHFPTKEALLEAVFIGRLTRLTERAKALADSEDPGPAFFAFFTLLVDHGSSKDAFANALTAAGVNVQAAASGLSVEFGEVLVGLLQRAQQAGGVRADIGARELKAVLVGASRAMEHIGADAAFRHRIIGILLDGLRPPAEPSADTARGQRSGPTTA